MSHIRIKVIKPETQKVKSNGRKGLKRKKKSTEWLVMERWSQVMMSLLSKWSVMVNVVMVVKFASQRLISVHLHLFCARLCLLASLCISLSFCSLLGCRAIMSSTVLLVRFRGLLHCGLWPVDDWITDILQFLVG